MERGSSREEFTGLYEAQMLYYTLVSLLAIRPSTGEECGYWLCPMEYNDQPHVLNTLYNIGAGKYSNSSADSIKYQHRYIVIVMM